MAIILVELIYNRKTIKFLQQLLQVNRNLPRRISYNCLRFLLTAMFIAGVIIFKQNLCTFYFKSLIQLLIIYYCLLPYVRYMFTFKFIVLCYVILDRFKTINGILIKFCQNQVYQLYVYLTIKYNLYCFPL